MTTLLFDLDGTLVDSSHDIIDSFRHSFDQMGLPQPDLATIISFIGPPLAVTFGQFFNQQKDIDRAVKYFRDHYEGKSEHQERIYDGIVDTLTTLIERGHALFVTTSKQEAIAKTLLDKLDLSSYFTAIYGAIPGGRQDKADVISTCLTEQGIDLTEVSIIGDTKYDMIGGKKIGIKTIGVTWGFGQEEELLTYGADVIIHQPIDLLSHVS